MKPRTKMLGAFVAALVMATMAALRFAEGDPHWGTYDAAVSVLWLGLAWKGYRDWKWDKWAEEMFPE